MVWMDEETIDLANLQKQLETGAFQKQKMKLWDRKQCLSALAMRMPKSGYSRNPIPKKYQ